MKNLLPPPCLGTIEMPHIAVYMNGADIHHRWQIIHPIASTEAIDVKIYKRHIVSTFVPNARHSVLICDVQYLEVLRKLDGLKIGDVELCLEYRVHTSVLLDASDDVTQAGEYWHRNGLHFGEYQILHGFGQFFFDCLLSSQGDECFIYLVAKLVTFLLQ